MKIVSLVPNSGARDVRVMKEAKSLAEDGHDVHVIGIREPAHTSHTAQILPRLRVHRVTWQAQAFRHTAKIFSLLAVLGLLVLTLIVLFLWNALDVSGAFKNFFSWAGGLYYSFVDLTKSALEATGGFNKNVETYNANSALNVTTVSHIGAICVLIGVVAVSLFIFRRPLIRLLKSGVKLVKKTIGFVFRPAQEFSKFAVSYGNLENMHFGGMQSFLNIVGTKGLLSYGTTKMSHWVNLMHYHSVQRFQRTAMVDKALGLSPDLIYCHEVNALEAAVALKEKLGVPLIYDAHEFYDALVQGAPHILRRYKNIHASTLKKVDAFVTVSDAIAELYKEEYPNMCSACIIKNATPLANFTSEYDGRLHEKADLPKDKKILLYQGGFASKRGIESVVDAAQYLSDDWSVVLMGWGSYESTLKELINNQAAKYKETVQQEYLKNVTDQTGVDLHERVIEILKLNYPYNWEDFLRREGRGGEKQYLQNDVQPEVIADTDSSSPELVNPAKSDVSIKLFLKELNELAQLKPTVEMEFFSKIQNLLTRRSVLENIHTNEYIYDKVRLIGPAPQEDLHLWTRGATIGVIPYPNDGLNHWACSPNKLWEYPNAGVPVLVSPCIELFKMVDNHKIGWVMPPDASGQKIAQIISNLDKKDIAKAKNGCAKFIKNDNWLKYEKRLIDLVNSFQPVETSK